MGSEKPLIIYPCELKGMNLRVSNNEMSIFVEVNEELTNTVKAAYYQAPVIMEGIDLTDRMKLPHITFSSDSMTVMAPESLEIEYTASRNRS